MEEQVRKELRELCGSILADDSGSDLTDQLTRVQMLYEKLMVANYLRESSPIEESVPEKTTPESFTHPESEDENPAAEEERINESPVPTEELTDDRTPEDQGPVVSRLNDIRAGKESKPNVSSINDRLGEGALRIGLNDRIAFVKHLFSGEQDDYNRVLSQISTFNTYNEVEDFLEKMVKPDYDWSQKEEYENRFLDLLKVKFGVQE